MSGRRFFSSVSAPMEQKKRKARSCPLSLLSLALSPLLLISCSRSSSETHLPRGRHPVVGRYFGRERRKRRRKGESRKRKKKGMAIDRAFFLSLSLSLLSLARSRETNLVKASSCKGVVAGHRSVKEWKARSVETTGGGGKAGAVERTLLRREKQQRFCVFARPHFFFQAPPLALASLSLCQKNRAATTSLRWRPLYSSRLRCRRRPAAAAAPAAAGLSRRQRQHIQQLGRRALSAAAAAKAGGNKLDHRLPLPPRILLLLPLRPRPRPPPTFAPPRRASSAMRASSSGTRRWYVHRESEGFGREKREKRGEEMEGSTQRFVFFFSSNLLLDLDLSSPSLLLPLPLNSTPRPNTQHSGLPQPPRRGLRRAHCLQAGVHGAVLEVSKASFFFFSLSFGPLSLSLLSLSFFLTSPISKLPRSLNPPLHNNKNDKTKVSRTASPSA